MKATDERLLTIGRFARLSGLSVKALRCYDEIELLEPARVDPETGYRYYSLAQARQAEAIRRLRALEMPLDEIRVVLEASPQVVRERLAAHRARLEGRGVELRRAVAELTRLIDGKEPLVLEKEKMVRFEVHIDDVEEQRMLAVRERTRADELSVVIPRAIEEVHAYLVASGVRPAGPPICVCPFPDDDGMQESTIGWPVEGDVAGDGRIEVETLPATRALVMKHTGPYDALPSSYRLMSELMEEEGLTATGDPREHYVTNPDEVPDPNDYETLIVWPIGPEGTLNPKGTFKRRVPPPPS
jgi:DNA-binding transcriptional MerR regulator